MKKEEQLLNIVVENSADDRQLLKTVNFEDSQNEEQLLIVVS
jgi:hypothetical protein